MGFLQHDTNNIILDAVLTDLGRQLLARNDGSFSIVKFAVGDDEVDYTIIRKYGRTIGREKIEKNTPVFEALTNAGYAQKYRCISVSNPRLIVFPNLTLQGEGVDTGNLTVTIGGVNKRRRTLTILQESKDTIDVELRDQTFMVEMNNMFLQIVGETPEFIDFQQRASYMLVREKGETAMGGSILTFTIEVKNLTETHFQVYGSVQDKRKIHTFVRVSGMQSGSVLEFQVTIDKDLA